MTLLVTVARKSSPCALSTSPGVPGPHAFAVRTRFARHATRATSIAFHPAFRGDRDPPLLPGWNGRIMHLIWAERQEKFCKSEAVALVGIEFTLNSLTKLTLSRTRLDA
jgi:hypothetical protein